MKVEHNYQLTIHSGAAGKQGFFRLFHQKLNNPRTDTVHKAAITSEKNTQINDRSFFLNMYTRAVANSAGRAEAQPINSPNCVNPSPVNMLSFQKCPPGNPPPHFSPDYVSSITFKDAGKKKMWVHYIVTHG
ncbi:hypothetical protein ACFLWS_04545 [Chloroflexota bacterium]